MNYMDRLPKDWRERLARLPAGLGIANASQALGLKDWHLAEWRKHDEELHKATAHLYSTNYAAPKMPRKKPQQRLERDDKGPTVISIKHSRANGEDKVTTPFHSLDALLDAISDYELTLRDDKDKHNLRRILLASFDALYDQSKSILHLKREVNAAKVKFARATGTVKSAAHASMKAALLD